MGRRSAVWGNNMSSTDNNKKCAAVPKVMRLSHPLAFTAFLKQVGAPIESYLRREKLPVYCEDPNVFVPVTAAWSLFSAAASREDSMIGWHVGQFVGDQNLNVSLRQKFDVAPSLYVAMQQFIELAGSEASHLQLGLYGRNDDILFYTHYPDLSGVKGYHVSQAYQIEVYVSLIQHIAGPDWLPAVIGLECSSIPTALKDRFPSTRILPNQAVGYLAVPRKILPLAGQLTSAPSSDKYEERGMDDTIVMADQFGYVDTLTSITKAYLKDGYPSATLAASLMGTSVRTLARTLSARGLCYSAVVDKVRFDTAKKLLLETSLNIEDVSHEMGFKDHSHFSRMFRRISGLSPREYRKSVIAG